MNPSTLIWYCSFQILELKCKSGELTVVLFWQCGMAESFNLSVATAITCAHMSAASKDGNGPLRPGDLSKKEYNTLLLKGVLNSMKPKLARALLKKHGIELPQELNIS